MHINDQSGSTIEAVTVHRKIDEAELAAAAFLARYSGSGFGGDELCDAEESPDCRSDDFAGGGVVGFSAAFDFGAEFGVEADGDDFGRGGAHELASASASEFRHVVSGFGLSGEGFDHVIVDDVTSRGSVDLLFRHWMLRAWEEGRGTWFGLAWREWRSVVRRRGSAR